MNRLTTLVVGALFVTACSDDSTGLNSSSIEMRTDGSSYAVQPYGDGWVTTEVIVRIKNNADKAAYLSRCNTDSPTPVYSVHRVTPRARDIPLEAAQDNGCPAGVPSIVVRPGEELAHTVRISYEPARHGIKAGNYVIVYKVFKSPIEDDRYFEAETNVFGIVE